MQNSIAVLAATPPPARQWRFHSARSATAEINRLESVLGLPHSPRAYNLMAMNARVRELETMLAAKSAAPKPAVPATTAPSVASAPVVEKFGLARAAAAVQIFGASKPQNEIPGHVTGRARFKAALKISTE